MCEVLKYLPKNIIKQKQLKMAFIYSNKGSTSALVVFFFVNIQLKIPLKIQKLKMDKSAPLLTLAPIKCIRSCKI